MHCRVNEANKTSSLHIFTNSIRYFLQFFCHTYQLHLEPAKSRKKQLT